MVRKEKTEVLGRAVNIKYVLRFHFSALRFVGILILQVLK